MYLGVAFVVVIILVIASPIIWVAWWLRADLGERASGFETTTSRGVTRRRHIPAA